MNKYNSFVHQAMQCVAWCTFLIFSQSCVSKKASTATPLRAIELTSSFPMPTMEGEISYEEDRMIQVEWQNEILQQISIPRNLSTLKYNAAGEVIGNELTPLPDGTKYFFYRMGETQGVFYDTAQYAPEVVTRADVDSVLELNTSTSFSQTMKAKILNDSLISAALTSDKTILVERYVPKVKKDLSYSDTTVLTYDKRLNGIRFSFSNEMDSTRKMKLSKIELRFSAIPNSPEKYRRQSRQITFEIKEVPVRDQANIIAIFNKLDSLTNK